MPHRKTPFRQGEYYHLYQRGNNAEPIFFERENYLFFLRQIRRHLLVEALEVVAYCLMPNHYHLLVHLLTDDLSRAMQAFLLSYTKAVNKRHGRVGTLFQGRFQSILVETDEYLLHLSRYIHLNPVEARLVAAASDWEFSSYPEYVGLRQGSLPRPQIVLGQIGDTERYRQFVEEYHSQERKRIAHLLVD